MFLNQNYMGLPSRTWLIIVAVNVALLIGVVIGIRIRRLLKFFTLKNLSSMAGFAYDPEQDIFYSEMDAWQRQFGYCHLYDEASPQLNMIIDNEPIRFRYGGKSWLIELWKGQYGMTTGAEIGVYYTRRRVGKSRKACERAFYKCVKDKDMLSMTIKLQKDGEVLFQRKQQHWWLTGFVIGEFSQPEDLIAVYTITFPNEKMQDAFIQALLDLGYRKNHLEISRLTVKVRFTRSLYGQISTRTPEREKEAQSINKKLCNAWRDITLGIDGLQNKLEAVREADYDLYKAAVTFGKSPLHYLSRKRFLRKEDKRWQEKR